MSEPEEEEASFYLSDEYVGEEEEEPSEVTLAEGAGFAVKKRQRPKPVF